MSDLIVLPGRRRKSPSKPPERMRSRYDVKQITPMRFQPPVEQTT